jgi:hypothetical protein
MVRTLAAAALSLAALGMATPASASLSVLNTYTGAVDVSTDGCGTTGTECVLTANVPVGATVLGAYLYTSTFGIGALNGAAGTFAGQATNYTSLGVNTEACCDLSASRMDVTGIVAPVINGGPGGAYNFTYTESNSGQQDGGALVVVYDLASLPTTTVAILDGFAAVNGDTAVLNFADPLDPGAPGFRAEMRLGIGFSFNGTDPAAPSESGQVSEVTVNGSPLTNVAGHCDDSIDGFCTNGNLITVGDDADPFSAILPGVAGDHEKYDISSLLPNGSTQIVVQTFNASEDDNIFLAVFAVTGEATVTTDTPEPMSIALLGVGLAGLGLVRRRRRG